MKARVVDLIRSHPRFVDQFQRLMPPEIKRGSDGDRNLWLFAHASTWPDLVRSASRGVTRDDVQEYSRPWWHFVDEPIFLNETEGRELGQQLGVNLSRQLPQDPDESFMNVIQATKNSARIVGDDQADTALRSVHLCWLLHLVGDAHQPLHSSALFTTHRFRKGDHGGNYVNIRHDYKLHGFWDDQISTDEPFETLQLLADDLAKNSELKAVGNQAAKSLDVGTWIDEGHELAKQFVYTPYVMKKISAAEGHPHLGDLNPPPSYEADAERVAEQRAVEAAYRLAKLLEQLLP